MNTLNFYLLLSDPGHGILKIARPVTTHTASVHFHGATAVNFLLQRTVHALEVLQTVEKTKKKPVRYEQECERMQTDRRTVGNNRAECPFVADLWSSR